MNKHNFCQYHNGQTYIKKKKQGKLFNAVLLNKTQHNKHIFL